MAQIDCIVFGEDEHERESIERMLGETGHIHVCGRLGRVEELHSTQLLDEVPPVVASLARRPEEILEALERGPIERAMLVVIGPPGESDWVLRSIRLGAREYLPPDVGSSRFQRLAEEILLMPTSDRGDVDAPIVGVLGAKGGAGTTTVASQLAAALQLLGKRVCVIDLDLQRGDLELFFDLRPQHSLAAVTSAQGSVDASFLESLVTVHAGSGVAVLGAPKQPEEAELVEAKHVERVLGGLRRQYDVVVVDLPAHWNDPTLKALDFCSLVHLVYGYELPSLSHARSQLELMRRLGIGDERIRLVANRANTRGGVRPQDAGRFLDRPADTALPNDYEGVMDAISSGVAIPTAAPKSALAKAYTKLARETLEACGLEQAERESSRLSRLRKLWRS